jgi:AAA domain
MIFSTLHALGTDPRCLANADHVDNTNANAETRAYWTALAKELKVPIRVVHFLSSPELCRHNNAVRAANKLLVSTPDPRSTTIEI